MLTTSISTLIARFRGLFHTTSSAVTASSISTFTRTTGVGVATATPAFTPLPFFPAPVYLGLPIFRQHQLFNVHVHSEESIPLPPYYPGQDPPAYAADIEVGPPELPRAGASPLGRRWRLECPIVWLLGIPVWFHVHVVPVEDEEDMVQLNGMGKEKKKYCLVVLFTLLVAGGIGVGFALPKMI